MSTIQQHQPTTASTHKQKQEETPKPVMGFLTVGNRLRKKALYVFI